MWAMEIRRVEGGFILNRCDEDAKRRRAVVGEPDTLTGGLEAMRDVLNLVLEYFDLAGSKHDKFRIEIKIVEQGQ